MCMFQHGVIEDTYLNSKCEHRMSCNHSAIKYFRDVTDDHLINQDNGAFSGPMALRRVVDDYTFAA
jgi:hypothetical protein